MILPTRLAAAAPPDAPAATGRTAAIDRVAAIALSGEIVQNHLLPDHGLSMILLTNRSSGDCPPVEVWKGEGFVFDLLSAAVCS